jgi:hypothetical protein
LFDLGKWHIPFLKIDTFYQLLAEDTMDGIWHYIIERRTNICRLVYDLDLQSLNEEQWTPIGLCIQMHQIICHALKDLTLDMIIMQTEDSDEKNKIGIHPVWPNVFLSSNEALLLRSVLIEELTNIGPPNDSQSWDDALDISVFMWSGLRPMGMRKASICPKCSGSRSRKGNCSYCGQLGTIDMGRPYWPTHFYDGSNDIITHLDRKSDIMPDHDTLIRWFKRTIIRSKRRKNSHIVHGYDKLQRSKVKTQMSKMVSIFHCFQRSHQFHQFLITD